MLRALRRLRETLPGPLILGSVGGIVRHPIRRRTSYSIPKGGIFYVWLGARSGKLTANVLYVVGGVLTHTHLDGTWRG